MNPWLLMVLLAVPPPPPPPPPLLPARATAPAQKVNKKTAKKKKKGAQAEPAPTPLILSVPTAPAPRAAAPKPASEPALIPAPAPVSTQVVAPPPKSQPRAILPDDDVPENADFITGPLVHVGTRELLSRYDHLGARLGLHAIDTELFVGVAPGLAWYFDNGLSLALHAPLKLSAVEGGSLGGGEINYGDLRVRRQDWDEVADLAKVIRFITYGRKEQGVYFTVNSMRPTTLGYGAVLNRYQGNIDVDRSMTGLVVDVSTPYVGFEMQLNDITLENRILGGLVYLRPASLFSDHPVAEGFSLGLEYVADFRAPRCVRLSASGSQCVAASGHVAGPDPFDGGLRDSTFVRTDPDTGRYGVNETTVSAAGMSGQLKLWRSGDRADLKLFGTYHRFLNEGGGDGAGFGFLARLSSAGRFQNAFRIQGQYLTYTDGFAPQYFDSLYEIQKYEYAGADGMQVRPTKYQAVFGDEANGFQRSSLGRRHGYNVEGSWALFQGSRHNKQMAVGLGLRDTTGDNDTQFYAHLEFPYLQFLQLFATFMRNNVAGLGEIMGSDVITAEETILLTGARLQILPFLFINAHYSRTYRATRSPGSEIHLGNADVVDEDGEASAYFPQERLFSNVPTLFVEVELGWEFSDD